MYKSYSFFKFSNCLLALLLLLYQSTLLANEHDEPKGCSIILIHIGESDKPIRPLIISDHELNEQEFKNELDNISRFPISQIILSREEMGKLCKESNQFRAKYYRIKLSLKSQKFRLTIIEEGNKPSTNLTVKSSLKYLGMIKRLVNLKKYPSLETQLSNLKKRML